MPRPAPLAPAHASGFAKTFALRGFVLMTLVGLLLALLGPFGTYLNGPFPLRLAYWLVSCWAGLLLYGVLVLYRVTRWRGTAGNWLVLIAGLFLASLPESLISRGFAIWLWPNLEDRFPPALTWYGQTVMLGIVLMLIATAWALHRTRNAPRPASGVEAAAVSLAPSPLAYPADILALQIEDHYLRVHRQHGSQLVLMPLKEAIAAMHGIEGMQTHRSWWVARAALSRATGTPRAMRLILANGLEVPVARSAVLPLREAGWLENA